MLEEIIVNQILQSFSTPIITLFFQIITFFGHPLPWIIISAWLFWLGKEKRSLMIISIILFAGFVTGALKAIIMRPRPEGLLLLDSTATGYSMPSGHSTLAGTILGFFENKVQKKEKYFILLLALLTALSRLYLGVHFVSDVIAGLLIGYLLGKLLLRLERKIEKSAFHITKIRKELLIIIIFVALIAGLFLLPEELFLAQTLLGYYLGFVLHKHTKNNSPRNKKTTLFLGTIIMAIFGGFAFTTTGAKSQLLFFTTGLFITLWPMIIARLKL